MKASFRKFFAGVSLVGFYLFAIGFFFFIAAFLKGVQVLVFVPALFLGIFLFSRFESERIRKTVGFSLERDKDSYRIFIHSPKPVGLSFRVAFADAEGNVSYAEPDPDEMAVPYPPSGAASVRLYYRGSFDLFRKVADLGPLPPESALVSGSEALSSDSYPISKKVRSGDFIDRIDAFRSSSSDVPYVKAWEFSQENAAATRPGVPKLIPVRSTVPLALPRASEKARSLEWKLVALCSGIMALQWESLAFAAYLAGTFAVFFLMKNVFGIPKLSKSVKTFATFCCFAAMAYVSWKESDLMGPVSVFLLQVLVIHFFYPDDRDESFLYIFLSLFVFATVSFLSIGVWFLAFFAVLLFLVLRLLFLSSGYLGKDSTSLPFKTEVPKKYLANSFVVLYVATFGFFAILPHGDGYRGGVALPTSENSETATSGLKDDIALGGLLNVKRDPSKKLVVKNPTEEERKAFSKTYWRGERFAAFDGTGWTAEKDSAYRYLPMFASGGDRISVTYYDPGSKILPLPRPAISAATVKTYRNAAFVQRVSDPYVHRIEEPMESAYEVSVTLSRTVPPASSYAPANAPLSPYVDALFADYWSRIPSEVSKDPLALAKYVRDESGFEYTVDAPASSLRSFLYEEKRGHCEYFATVLAVTLRHFGFPATVVNGYYSGEYSRLSDSWIIRGEEAHAWVELIQNGHWTVYDPTPNSGVVVKSAAQEWKAAVVSAYDYVDLVWFTYVVGYSGTAQLDLLANLAKLWPFALVTGILGWSTFRGFKVLKERSRRSKLSFKEKFLEDFRKLAGGDFPLAAWESIRPELVRKTRVALYAGRPFGSADYDSLLSEWGDALRTKE